MKKHMKVGVVALSALLSFGALTSCGEKKEEEKPAVDVEVSEVKVTEEALQLYIGDTHKLTVSVLPDNATNKAVTYSSSKETVAKVTEDGTIMAIGEGLAIITVSSANGKKANVAVSVSKKQEVIVEPTEITVGESSYDLIVGDERTITYGVLPENATNKNVEFLTDAKNVATVSSEGVIKAVGVGEATITVRSQAKATVVKTIAVNVESGITPVTSIEVAKSSISLHPGETETISYTVLPENATNKEVKFSVKEGGDTVCSVSPEGVVTANGVGDTTVYVQSRQDGSVFNSVDVHVENVHTPVTDVVIGTSAITLAPTQTSKIEASVEPENATNKGLLYESSSAEVATVSTAGIITALSLGQAVITVKSADNEAISKTIIVTVENTVVSVTGVTLEETELKINIGDLTSYQLHAGVEPSNASNPTLKYETDNAPVATVSQAGLVTINGVKGVAHITVKSSENESLSKTFTLTVDEVLITKITLKCDGSEVSKLNFTADQIGSVTKTLVAEVEPANPTDGSILWSSKDETIASVAGGVVTPLKIGSTVIKAKNVKSGVEAEVDVTVSPVDVTGIVVKLDDEEVDSISVSTDKLNTSKTLVATVLPDNATNKNVKWTSSNTSVVTVNGGVITFVGVGSAVVRVSSEDDPNIYKEINVLVSEVLVSKIELRVNDNQIDSLTFSVDDIGVAEKKIAVSAVVTPATAYNTSIEWAMVDESIAKVSSTGVVEPIDVGDTTLIARNLKSGVEARIPVHVVGHNNYSLSLPVAKNKSFTTYETNRAEKVNKNEEFINRSEVYKVGCDNRINLLPILDVRDKRTGDKVDQANWAFDFSVLVERKVSEGVYTPAEVSEYSVLSARTCEVKFAPETVGNAYRVSIIPGAQEQFIEDEEDLIAATAVYEFSIVKGYNVYRPEELGYFDTTTASTYDNKEFNFMFSGETTGDGAMQRTKIDWPKFKRENNLPGNVTYDNLVLQDNIYITKDSIPSSFFYSEEEGKLFADDAEREHSVGSFKDYCYAYVHHGKDSVTLEGNYFTLDFASIPLVTRPFGEQETTDNKLDSHSSLFKTTNGNTTFKNINVIGNAHNSEDGAYAGGLFMFKAADNAEDVAMDNVLTHSMYINVMSELPSQGARIPRTVSGPVNININNMKSFDNYNTFLYNWGGELHISNSTFEGCGGPVLIQDHTDVNTKEPEQPEYNVFDKFLEDGSFHINGYAPYVEFADCQFRNYVMGEEAWFQSFDAVSAAMQVKALSDGITLASSQIRALAPGFPLAGFLTADVGGVRTPITAQAAAEGGVDSDMNFIVLNKSGSAQAATTVPVDGNVKFTEGGAVVDQFNYCAPANGETPTAEKKESYQNFRKVQSNFLGLGLGLPVFETKGGKAAVNPDAGAIYDVDKAANATGLSGLDYDFMTGNVLNVTGKYIAIYYNGMMLVMEMYRF